MKTFKKLITVIAMLGSPSLTSFAGENSGAGFSKLDYLVISETDFRRLEIRLATKEYVSVPKYFDKYATRKDGQIRTTDNTLVLPAFDAYLLDPK